MNSSPPGGPYVTVASFCERVLTEADGVQSAIRIIDRVTLMANGSSEPPEGQRVIYEVWYVLMLKSGRARGRHAVRLEMERPDTSRTNAFTQDVLFEGEERGSSFAMQIRLELELEGVYWMHVYVGENHLTQTPLRFMWQRTSIGRPSTNGGQ